MLVRRKEETAVKFAIMSRADSPGIELHTLGLYTLYWIKKYAWDRHYLSKQMYICQRRNFAV